VVKPNIVRGSQIRAIGVGFQARFQGALASSKSIWQKIATEVPSETGEEDYGFLLDLPDVREWVGDRRLNEFAAAGYTIKNKDWELTFAVDRNAILDDKIGLYGPKIDMFADSTGRSYDKLIFQLLVAGFTTACYDTQYFFDTDHPVLDANGVETQFANTDGGASYPWFLAVTGMPLLPVILQKRQDWQFTAMDKSDDERVFMDKKFRYGVDARHNVGYSLPQLCWGSKQTLDVAHFNTARQSLINMPKDGGGKIAPSAFTLFVGPSNLAAAESIIEAQNLANGASNTNYKKAELVVVPYLG